MSDTPPGPLTFTAPNLTTNFPITSAGHFPSQQFIANYRQVVGQLSTGIANLTNVLNGTTPFTGINVGGVNNQRLLSQNSNGSSIVRPQGLGNSVVTTGSVAQDAITAPVTVDTTAASPATSTIVITNNANLQMGDFFTIGTETWTASDRAEFGLWIIGATADDTAANIASAMNGTSNVVIPAQNGSGAGLNTVFLTTLATGTGANSTTATFTPIGSVGATITAFTGGAANTVITTAGVFVPLLDADLTINIVGGQTEINGRFSITHNQTSVALYHVKVDRIKSPVGASSYTDEVIAVIPGFNSIFSDIFVYFQDNELNGKTGTATYRFSIEVTNNTGVGYQQTTNGVLAAGRNFKR